MRTVDLVPSGNGVKAAFRAILVGIAAVAVPALAEPAPTRTPEEIVKALGVPAPTKSAAPFSEDEEESIPVGNQKAFSLAARSTPAKLPAAATSNRVALASRGTASARGSAPRAAVRRDPLDMRVTFPTGSAEMTEQARAEARVFAQALQSQQLAGVRFNVDGHTDAVGDRSYNLELSRRRAQAVVDYLVAQGADASRLVATGYGFDRPRPGKAPTAPDNRRVEFARAN